MNEADVNAQWQRLCEEQESAKRNYDASFAIVHRKFLAMGQGLSDEEMSKFEETRRILEDVHNRMHEFVRENA